jgi:hypothetical protein
MCVGGAGWYGHVSDARVTNDYSVMGAKLALLKK